jgi:hypothetical protein
VSAFYCATNRNTDRDKHHFDQLDRRIIPL